MTFTFLNRRTEAEKKLDILILNELNKATTFTDILNVMALMEKRNALKRSKHYISPDTMAVIFGNLLGILLIIGHEKTNVITTKAISFVLRGRV